MTDHFVILLAVEDDGLLANAWNALLTSTCSWYLVAKDQTDSRRSKSHRRRVVEIWPPVAHRLARIHSRPESIYDVVKPYLFSMELHGKPTCAPSKHSQGPRESLQADMYGNPMC